MIMCAPSFRQMKNCAMLWLFWTLPNSNYHDSASILLITFLCGVCVIIFKNKRFLSFEGIAVSASLYGTRCCPPFPPAPNQFLAFVFRHWTVKVRAPFPTLYFGTLLTLLTSSHAEKSLAQGSKKPRIDNSL